MKNTLATTLQKLSILCLTLTLVFATALPAQADFSQENKDTLKEVFEVWWQECFS